MELFTRILLQAEFDTPLLLRLFSDADVWEYSLKQNPLWEILDIIFLRVGENSDISNTATLN